MPTVPRLLVVILAGALATFGGGCSRTCPDLASPQVKAAKLDFVLKDMDGKSVRLADFKGRPLILNFWATWCGPCKDEIPGLVQLVNEHRGDRLAVLGVSTDDKPEELKTFAAEYKINYPVLVGLGHDDLLDAYDAQVAIPISWLVDACGVVAEKHMGIWTKQDVDAAIRKLL